MDNFLSSITKLVAGPEAALAIKLLGALGKIMKDVKAGTEPDFHDLSAAIMQALPPKLLFKATVDEINNLARTGYDFAKAVAAVLN